MICVSLGNCEAWFHFEQGRDLGFRLIYASEEWERVGKIEVADPKLFDRSPSATTTIDGAVPASWFVSPSNQIVLVDPKERRVVRILGRY